MKPLFRRLSPRQRQIVKLAAAGKTNKEIAATLSISKGTVKNHMTRIFDRLGAVSRTQAAIFCQ